jgi:hypothetical protein
MKCKFLGTPSGKMLFHDCGGLSRILATNGFTWMVVIFLVKTFRNIFWASVLG